MKERSRFGAFVLAAVLFPAACTETDRLPTAVSGVEGPGLTGMLVDESGEPLSWVNVMACTRAVCYYSDSAADGRFLFFFDGAIEGLIKTAGDLSTEPRLSSPMVPFTIEGDEFLDVGTVHVPFLPEGAPVEPGSSGIQSYEAGDGLVLEIDPSAIETAAGSVFTDVAARRLPDDIVPEYPGIDPEDVAAVYAIHPFAATSSIPIGIRIPADLPDGTPVRLMTIDEVDGTFAESVEAMVEGNAVVSTEGAGITRLTHLVAVRAD